MYRKREIVEKLTFVLRQLGWKRSALQLRVQEKLPGKNKQWYKAGHGSRNRAHSIVHRWEAQVALLDWRLQLQI